MFSFSPLSPVLILADISQPASVLLPHTNHVQDLDQFDQVLDPATVLPYLWQCAMVQVGLLVPHR